METKQQNIKYCAVKGITGFYGRYPCLCGKISTADGYVCTKKEYCEHQKDECVEK